MNQAQPLLNQHLKRAAQAAALVGAGAGGTAIVKDISDRMAFGNYEPVPGEEEAMELLRAAAIKQQLEAAIASGAIAPEQAEAALMQLGGMAQPAPAAGEGQLNIG